MEVDRVSVRLKVAAIACAAIFTVAGTPSRAQTQDPSARAQQPQVPAAPQTGTPARPAAQAPSLAPQPEYPKVVLTAGRSTVLTTDFNITRIAVTNPTVADATVVQPREVLIDGKAPGTISLIVWGGDTRSQYDLVVQEPVSPLQQN